VGQGAITSAGRATFTASYALFSPGGRPGSSGLVQWGRGRSLARSSHAARWCDGSSGDTDPLDGHRAGRFRRAERRVGL